MRCPCGPGVAWLINKRRKVRIPGRRPRESSLEKSSKADEAQASWQDVPFDERGAGDSGWGLTGTLGEPTPAPFFGVAVWLRPHRSPHSPCKSPVVSFC